MLRMSYIEDNTLHEVYDTFNLNYLYAYLKYIKIE